MKQYLTQNAIAFDQLINALVLGGYADETLSSRAHRMREKGQRYWGWTANAIDRIFFWQVGHCALAHEAELRRWQLPPRSRNPPIAGFFTPE